MLEKTSGGGSPSVIRDDDLLEAWSEGDTAAGQLLYERYFPLVHRFFSRRLSRDVEDLVQRTFLACTKHRDRLRDGSSFRGFVFVVARNELNFYLRTRYRQGQPVDLSTTHLADVSDTVYQIIIRHEEHHQLRVALRRIPQDLQEVLELSYFERLKGPELAATLAIPEGTVRSRLRRAIDALRTEFQRI